MGNCVLIAAGGTGGHVFPALAVADELRRRGVDVVWVGTRKGLEATVVPNAGYHVEWLNVRGLRGKHILDWALAPYRLTVALWQALNVVRKLKPRAVLGMGGYVTGPTGVASRLMNVPLIVHEQNAIPGVTNRLLMKIAQRVLQAFPDTFVGNEKIVTTGNPVRNAIAALAAPAERFAKRQGPLRVFVVGGSLGAQALNATVPQAVAKLPREVRPQILHQTGMRHLDEARRHYSEANVEADVVPFIEKMEDAYSWADLVICRAGAMTIAELAAVGVAAILVPFPFAVDDHQTHNAKFLVNAHAAELIQQRDLTEDRLKDVLMSFGCVVGADATAAWAMGRKKLLQMAEAARALARPQATQHVADICLEVARA